MTEVVGNRPRALKEPPVLTMTNPVVNNRKVLRCNWLPKVMTFEEKKKEIIFKKRSIKIVFILFLFLCLITMLPMVFIRNGFTLFIFIIGLFLLLFMFFLLLGYIDLTVEFRSPDIKQTAMVLLKENSNENRINIFTVPTVPKETSYEKRTKAFTYLMDTIRKRPDLGLIDKPNERKFFSDINYVFQNGNEISAKFKDRVSDGPFYGWIKIRYHFKYYEHAQEVQKIVDEFLYSKGFA
jgi:hypothetical protein